MEYAAGETYRDLLVITDPTTEQLVDPTSITIVARRNGTEDGSFVLSANFAAVGEYEVSGTVPGGYTPGDTVTIMARISAGGLSYGKECMPFRVKPALDLQDVQDVIEADMEIDTGVTPWAMVWKKRGTGVELFRKDLKTVADGNITSINILIGKMVQ
jgi:hypothetical protein